MTNVEAVPTDYQGRMSVPCPECKALHWDAEKLSGSTRDGIVFGMCCLTGKVELPLPQQAPTGLQKLFDGRDAHSAFFLKNIRQYNAMFAFTSIGIQNHSITGGGPYVFKIRGELHHRIGAFLPMNDEREKYAQIYIIDQQSANNVRLSNNANLQVHPEVMQTISDDLQQYHQYVLMFKHAYERLWLEESRGATDMQVCLRVDPTTDGRRYNLPTSATEIAIAMPETGESNKGRDIILRLRSAGHQRISEMHPAYLTLHYVLLFPRGEFGWHKRIPHKDVNLPQVNNNEEIEMEDPDDNSNSQHKRVTQREFYAHMLHQRVIDHKKFIIYFWHEIYFNNL